MTSRTIRVDGVELTINASPELPEEAVHVAEMEPGRHLVTLRFSGARSGDDWVALSWNEPLGDATGFWHPAAVWNRSLRAPWTSRPSMLSSIGRSARALARWSPAAPPANRRP